MLKCTRSRFFVINLELIEQGSKGSKGTKGTKGMKGTKAQYAFQMDSLV